MFQNKVFLMIVALGAIQATFHNESYEVKPDCNKSYSAGHHKSGSHSHKSVYGGAYSFSVKDKIDGKNQASWDFDTNGSVSKPEKDLFETDKIKDNLENNMDLTKKFNGISNKDDIHDADSTKVQNSSSLDNKNNINKDSSDIKQVKDIDSSNNGNIQTGISSEENPNTVNGTPSVSGQKIGLDLKSTGVNENSFNSLDSRHPEEDIKPINSNTNNLRSLDNNNLISNNIKTKKKNQDDKLFNNINQENQANLNIKDNKLEANDNASHNINISSKPNQQNSGAGNIKLNPDNKNQATKPGSAPVDSNLSSNNINGAPTVIPNLLSQEVNNNAKPYGKISITLPKDGVDVNTHKYKDSAYGKPYGQQSNGQEYHY